MTTALHRPHIVTARIDTAQPPAPAPADYTVTVYVNTARRNFDGYRPRHPLAEVTHPDGSPLRLGAQGPPSSRRSVRVAPLTV